MARVEIASQAWGWLVDATGNPLGNTSATLKNLDGTNATHWSAITAGTSATTALTSNADGTLPRFVEEGSYDLTVSATTRRVEAATGQPGIVNAKTLGAIGDGVTDDSTTLQAGLTAAAGGTLFIPAGTYLISTILTVPDNAVVMGAGMGATILKVKDSASIAGALLLVENKSDVEIRDLEIDLNKANTTGLGSDTQQQAIYFAATSATGIKRCAARRVRVHDGERVGIYLIATSTSNPLEAVVEGCEITDCVRMGIHVRRPSNVKILNNTLSGNGDATSDQIQVGAAAADGGSNILVQGNYVTAGGRSGISFTGTTDYRCIGNHVTAHTAGTTNAQGIAASEGSADFVIAGNVVNGSGNSNITIDPRTSGSSVVKDLRSVVANNVCSDAVANHGIYCQYSRDVVFSGNVCHTNAAGNGIQIVAATDCLIVGNVCRGNVVGLRSGDNGADLGGPHLFVGNRSHSNTTQTQDAATNKSRFEATYTGESTSIASAATITLHPGSDVFTVTGTTTITSVTGSWAGRRVTLVFSGALTFTDGSNLKLAGNFVTTADDTITLVSDGTNWIETGRSVN